jgi:hypothetical protein
MKYLLFAIVMAFDALFIVAAVAKLREVAAAKHWMAAAGRIISSRAEVRRVARPSDNSDRRGDDYELRNFAAVTYEFQTPQGPRRGTRLSISADIGNSQVEEKLARYPRGSEITVYYDPADPKRCVIERDMSESSIRIAITIGIGFALTLLALLFRQRFGG